MPNRLKLHMEKEKKRGNTEGDHTATTCRGIYFDKIEADFRSRESGSRGLWGKRW